MSKTCNHCKREDATKGDHCQPCHATILAMGVIRRSWGTGEYATLAERLREGSFAEFKRTAIANGAMVAANLGDMLCRLSFLSGIGEDRFKSFLFSAMNADRLEMEIYEKMPGGIDAWRDRVGREMAESAALLAKKAHQETMAARIRIAAYSNA